MRYYYEEFEYDIGTKVPINKSNEMAVIESIRMFYDKNNGCKYTYNLKKKDGSFLLLDEGNISGLIIYNWIVKNSSISAENEGEKNERFSIGKIFIDKKTRKTFEIISVRDHWSGKLYVLKKDGGNLIPAKMADLIYIETTGDFQ